MSEHDIIVTGIVTGKGKVLVGEKEEGDHPIAGEKHFPGGRLEGEDPEKVLKQKLKEKTGIEVTIHHLIDFYHDGKGDVYRAVYHCEAEDTDTKPDGSIADLEWLPPANIEEELKGENEENLLERERIENLFEKLEQMPGF